MADIDVTEMEEDEDIPRALREPSERIYYGSLEEQEKNRSEKSDKIPGQLTRKGEKDAGGVIFEQKEGAESDSGDSEEEEGEGDGDGMEIQGAGDEDEENETETGDMQTAAAAPEAYELTESMRKQKEIQESKLAELMLRRRARALAVPTKDEAVRSRLRALGEPITLFGEREMERRDRLREVMARLDAAGELDKLLSAREGGDGAGEDDEDEDERRKVELFYTEGTAELLHARGEIAQFSLKRAKHRIVSAKRRRESPDEDEDEELEEVLKMVAQTSMQCSEIGDERPVSACAFSPDVSVLATGSWSGMGKLWKLPALAKEGQLKGHTERITAAAFHPRSCLDQEPSAANLATASADRKAIVWSLRGDVLRTFEGHLDRLARVAFHPSGNYLGTASFDKTWRLWDIESGQELLLQEGHSRSVYGIAFQCDGSLVATCGLDALARVWDLRTGRSILALEGHVKPVLGLDFSPNGYHLATAGEDHSCRVWDLRKRRCLYTIPAHTGLISQVKYEPRDGHFLVTASFDNTARVWSGRDFKAVKTLAGHEGKVMGVDVAPDGQSIVTVSYDRTIKLWAQTQRAQTDDMF
eukprot:TRINITY_DN472_c0_g2_i1.p1 TRINITY_DN472_c0_g2~~TRINITY_DN472_c0_g2_i1.p1  ORF type:complete len:586 (+),score=90.77 TRINITY_DN472_c0_g2_i1:412-2169(+)